MLSKVILYYARLQRKGAVLYMQPKMTLRASRLIGSFQILHQTQTMTKQWGSEAAAAQVGQAGIVSAERQQQQQNKSRQ